MDDDHRHTGGGVDGERRLESWAFSQQPLAFDDDSRHTGFVENDGSAAIVFDSESDCGRKQQRNEAQELVELGCRHNGRLLVSGGRRAAAASGIAQPLDCIEWMSSPQPAHVAGLFSVMANSIEEVIAMRLGNFATSGDGG
ncbi:MAG: hypothetical protein ABIT83_05230 [Massilia sp.]